MDTDAKDDAETIIELLGDAGISARLLDDSAPGVPSGVFEVQVAAARSDEAERVIAENPLTDEVNRVDASRDLDLETVYRGEATAMAEIEAIGIKSLLEANGIAVVMVGDSVLPNLAFEVRVARDRAAQARQMIAEAEAEGRLAAEEGEIESESGAN